jgi:proteasome lid subunit RPN8/RPN11
MAHAADFKDQDAALWHGHKSLGATHWSFGKGRTFHVYVPTEGGGFERKEIYAKRGLWHFAKGGAKKLDRLPLHSFAFDKRTLSPQYGGPRVASELDRGEVGRWRDAGRQDAANVIDVSEIRRELGPHPTKNAIKTWLLTQEEPQHDYPESATKAERERLLDAWADGWAEYAASAMKNGASENPSPKTKRFRIVKGVLAGRVGELKAMPHQVYGGAYGYPLEVDGQIYTFDRDMVEAIDDGDSAIGMEGREGGEPFRAGELESEYHYRGYKLGYDRKRDDYVVSPAVGGKTRFHSQSAIKDAVDAELHRKHASDNPQGGEPFPGAAFALGDAVIMLAGKSMGAGTLKKDWPGTIDRIEQRKGAAGIFYGVSYVDAKGKTKHTYADADELRHASRVGEPFPSSSNEAAECGCDPKPARAEAAEVPDAVPWVRIARDPALYEEGMKRAREIGPIEDPRQIYELLSPALSKESQEVFIVVLCNVKRECIGACEVHRGEKSRVQVSRADVLQIVTKAGADHFYVVHNHPSGDPTPSPADRDLTKAMMSGADNVDVPCVDHVVIGMGRYYSFAAKKTFKAK